MPTRPFLAPMLLLPFALASCAQPPKPPTPLAAGVQGPAANVQVTPEPLGGVAEPRVNGDVGSPNALLPAQLAFGRNTAFGGPRGGGGADLSGPDVTLDFTDTDIRDVVTQILGDTLHATYSIDPAVRGTATFHSAQPLPRAQMIPILQSLLAQNNAALVQTGNVYRVAPAASAGVPSFSANDAGAGGAVIPLRYASAEDLVKVLQPVVGAGGKLAAASGENAIIVWGEPQAREALSALVRSFDTDVLAGQSYALLPVPNGDAKDLASTLQDAFRSQTGGALAGLVRVLPLTRADAVLVVATNPRYLAEAQRVYALVQRSQKLSDRSWHVYYLQNSRADDIAYVLQKAFTPKDVTAQPESASQNQNGSGNSGSSSSSGGIGGSSGGISGGSGSSGGSTGIGSFGGIGQSSSSGGTGTGSSGSVGGLTLANQSSTPGSGSGANPLIGSLEGGGGEEDVNAMRIIPNPQNNAILIYGTQLEDNTVEAMLQKIDLLPLEVRIDATIAEVTLNDQLQFGTQFFFKEGSVNQMLSTAATGFTSGQPGFVIAAKAMGVQATLSALQAVTTVHVLSSPELMVLDNQPASLQVGALVPYLTQSAESTLTSTAQVVNSVSYEPTGIILQVTPRVNSDGEVTMDISQEVSSVDTAATSASTIGSPTFDDRVVKSRVVVHDGQTLGIAGLISDNISKGNSGVPFLKDVPVLGLLFGTQTNNRARTELLVMITPHVVHDQRDALKLTQDLKDQLVNAAAVPDESATLEPSGSVDPSARLRRRLGLQP
jgi:general secretion pathway protein D